MKRYFLLLLCILLMSTQSEAGIYRDDVAVGKYKALAAEPQFDCVGIILDERDSTQRGSCVLVGDRYVVSAAHCFVDAVRVPDTLVENGQMIIVDKIVSKKQTDVTKLFFSFNGVEYRGKRATLYPTYLNNNTGSGFGDLVVIELEHPVKGITPAILYNGRDEMGATVTGVGYGASGKADGHGSAVSNMEKLAGQNTVDSMDGEERDGMHTMLVCDFDCPGKPDECNKMGSEQPLPLEYIATGGDSGGGLFIHTKDGWRLAGVFSRTIIHPVQMQKTGYYGQVMKWVRVSAYYDWINAMKRSYRVK